MLVVKTFTLINQMILLKSRKILLHDEDEKVSNTTTDTYTE